ncbi:MAG TPA: hypothetical protein VLG12_01765 [Candidatus Saccharimonadales bacterium]|nr:hypothetical protein [Candidatus Saccharimonadales bacterium]
MDKLTYILLNLISGSISQIFLYGILLVYIFLCIRFKISGQNTAKIGFGFLICTSIAIVLTLDDIAGFLAQFAFIFFSIAFVQQFIHFLKHENI